MSLRPTPDPRREPGLTLNQFNAVVALDGSSADISQLHYYTFNPAFVNALPPWLRGHSAERVQAQLLRRLTVALGVPAVVEVSSAARSRPAHVERRGPSRPSHSAGCAAP